MTQNCQNFKKIYTFLSTHNVFDVVLGGDINAEHSSWSLSQSISYHKEAKGKDIHNYLRQCGLSPLIRPTESNYTRVDLNGNNSWLDVIFVSNSMINQFKNYHVQDTFSDHRMLKVNLDCTLDIATYRSIPTYQTFCITKFNQYLRNVYFDFDTDNLFQNFMDTISNIIKKSMITI